MIRSLLLLLPAAIALAQDSGGIVSDNALKIPVLGFAVTNSPLSVRPIAGSPGAMVLGGAIPLPAGVSSVIPVPGQQFAIVEQAGGSGVLTLDLSTPQNVSPIAGSFAHSDRIAFSPSGSVAALYSNAAHQAQVITGLPASAQISRTVDLSAAGAAVTSLAISDDGQALLAGVSDGTRGAIWSFAAGQTAQQITAAGVPSALRFFAGRHDAVAADKGWQQVLLIASGAVPRTLAGAVQGIKTPADLEISTDQQTVWVADANAVTGTPLGRRGKVAGQSKGKLFSIDVTSGAVAAMDSSITAAALTHLTGDSVFLLTSEDGASTGVWSPALMTGSIWKLTGASVE